ncbi:MAG: leucine-rich repeat protein [Oscillospiraceae bacterium]|nr:leucine-rich repeat protein [Oscillospiraceae bacterium]
MRVTKAVSLIAAGVLLLGGCASLKESGLLIDSQAHNAALEEFWGDQNDIPETPQSDFLYHFDDATGEAVITNYIGDAYAVKVPEYIDGHLVTEVDLRYCYKYIKALILPDTVVDVRIAGYDDITSQLSNTNITHQMHLSFFYVSEKNGITINDYTGHEAVVRIPTELEDPLDVNHKYTVKKVDLRGCEKDIRLLIIPECVEYISAKRYEDVIVSAEELSDYIRSNRELYKGVKGGIGVEKMNIPASYKWGENRTFAGTTLKSVFVPQTLSRIKSSAFSRCPLLTEVVLDPESVEIGDHAFYECGLLEDIDISCATDIGDWAFGKCSSLSELSFGDGLKNVGEYSFESCVSLQKVYFSDTSAVISGNAFDGCEQLKS